MSSTLFYECGCTFVLSGPYLREADCPNMIKPLSCQIVLRQAGQSNLHTHLPFLHSKLGKASWSGESGKEVRTITRLKSLEGGERAGEEGAGQENCSLARGSGRRWSQLLEPFI